MKKVYDWNINLQVNIKNFKQNLTITCSVHTSIHLLKI